MRVEDSRLRSRLKRPLLVLVGVVAVLVVPTWLWFHRGRTVPLSVVLDPPRFVVKTGTRVPLRPRITPEGADVVVSWAGSGIHPDKGGQEAVWQASAEPGIQHVVVTVRRSGTRKTDSVSFHVVSKDPELLPLSRPPPDPLPAPTGLPACPGTAPTVKFHGRPCVGANLVAEVQGVPNARSWHWWGQRHEQAVTGRMANVRLGSQNKLTSLVAPPSGSPETRCVWTITTEVKPEACQAGLDQPVFAAFSWQMKGPGHFRLAAKPPRTTGVRVVSYRWTFDDGRERKGDKPQVSHRFGGAIKRWHLVKLEVEALKTGSKDRVLASAVRALHDRSVKQ
jgi:hypothetical protein